jgi:Protein of unknown function (DUF3618)
VERLSTQISTLVREEMTLAAAEMKRKGEGERAPMSSNSERQRLHEEQLLQQIAELRGELGETVEALVHKADLPARAKQRGAELTEQALDRGLEVQQQILKRGSEFGAQARGLYGKIRIQANGRAREEVDKAAWIKLAAVGLALVATAMVIMRRLRA